MRPLFIFAKLVRKQTPSQCPSGWPISRKWLQKKPLIRRSGDALWVPFAFFFCLNVANLSARNRAILGASRDTRPFVVRERSIAYGIYSVRAASRPPFKGKYFFHSLKTEPLPSSVESKREYSTYFVWSRTWCTVVVHCSQNIYMYRSRRRSYRWNAIWYTNL